MTTLKLSFEDNNAIIRFVPGLSGVPVLDLTTLQHLADALDRIESERGLERLILATKGDGAFLTGPSLDCYEELEDGSRAESYSRVGQELLERLARLAIPSVAAISGNCLGGGLELALAARIRVLVDAPSLRLGFSDSLIGLLPAWGGAWRLSRLIGPTLALEMLRKSLALDPARALRWGLVDQLAPAGDLLSVARSAGPRRPRLRLLDRLLGVLPLLRFLVFRRAAADARRLAPDLADLPAPHRLVRLVELSLIRSPAELSRFERDAFKEAATSPGARRMRQALLRHNVASSS